MAEKDPAKQTPDGQKTRPGTTPSSSQRTADSSQGKPGAKASSSGGSSSKSSSSKSTKAKSSGSASSSSGSSKTSVQVSLDQVQTDILDNLRDATTRHDYVQRLVGRHLDAANPNAVFQEDDDLPGNERELKHPNLRI